MNRIFNIAIIALLLSSCSATKKSTSSANSGTTNPDMNKVPEPKNYNGSATRYFDLINTTLHVSFDIPNKKMAGTAEITLKPHFYATDQLYLNARGMDINEVKLIKGDTKEELAYEYKNDSIGIKFNHRYTIKDTLQIYIDYVAKPEELQTTGGLAITSDKGLYFINPDGSEGDKPTQIWTQGETQSNSVWFPTIDRPNQRMTDEIYITIDTSFVTLSNGKLISSIVNSYNGTRTDYWKMSLPHAPYLVMMAIGKFAVVKDKWRNIDVDYYVEPEYEKYARNIFGKTPAMMEFFSNKLGVDYAWEKYSEVVVRDYVSGAMENTTATLFGEFMQQDNREQLDQSYEDVVSHELFHHWFGDLVTCESWSNVPLNESFATYGEYLWNEHEYGREQADYYGQKDLNEYLHQARTKEVDLIRFDYNKPDDMFDNTSYEKGGRVLHMLRKYVGDDAFFASLKLYLNKNRFTAVEIHNLRLAFEEVTGEDLNWFFNEWFLDKGHPSLKINYNYDDAKSVETVSVEQVQSFETTPLYKLPVDIDIYEGGHVTRTRVTLTHQTEKIELPVKSKPDLVNFDAEKMLLCTKTDNKSPEEWVFMFKNAPLYLDRYEALVKISKDYEAGTPAGDVMLMAISDKFWNIRSYAIQNCSKLIKADKEGMKAKLMGIAVKDEKAKVRESAISALSDNYKGDDEVLTLMKNSTKDSSYNVMSDAYDYIIENDQKEGLKMVANLENENNDNIKEIVSDFYAKYGTDAQAEYMGKVVTGSKARYGSVQDYGKFLLLCSPDVAQAGLDKLADVGAHNGVWYIRLAAVQGLSEIAKSYGKKAAGDNKAPGDQALKDRIEMENGKVKSKAEELVNKIKDQEKDANLKKIYNRN